MIDDRKIPPKNTFTNVSPYITIVIPKNLMNMNI